MQDIVTADLSRFGARELGMAADLLSAFADGSYSSDLFGADNVTLNFNGNSGCVFLCDDDCNCLMLHGEQLEVFSSLPDSGQELWESEVNELVRTGKTNGEYAGDVVFADLSQDDKDFCEHIEGGTDLIVPAETEAAN